MSVITNFPATPNRLAILFRFLKSYPEGLPQEEVRALLSPRALRRKDDEDEQAESLADGVLVEARFLGLTEEAGPGAIRVPGHLLHLDETGLFRHLEDALLHPDRAAKLGQAQFPLALAWFLTVDPADSLDWIGNHRQRVEAECGIDSHGFELTNNRRFQNMIYWARYLGFVSRLEIDKTNLAVPDPTEALDRHLRVLLSERAELSAAELFSRLGERSPVFETGVARRQVEEMMGPRQRPRDLISRSTSLGLLRLERRRVIRLERRADAPAMRLGVWPDERPMSHIILNG